MFERKPQTSSGLPAGGTMSVWVNSLYTSFGGIARLVVSVVTAPLLIRLLGVEEYGVLAVCYAVIGLSSLGQLGLVSAVNIYLAADYAQRDHARARRTFATALVLLGILGGSLSLALILASGPLSGMLFPDEAGRREGMLALQLMLIPMVLRFWSQLMAEAEGALLRYDLQVMIESPMTFLRQIGLCLAAYLTGKAWAVALFNSIVDVALCALHALVIRRLLRDLPARWAADTATAKRLIQFGIKQWLNGLGSVIFNNVDRLVINSLFGAAAVGIYSAAVTVAAKIVEVSAGMLRVFPPAISAAYALGDHARIYYLLQRGIRANGAVCFLGTSGLLFFSPWVAEIVLGPAHAAQAVPVIQVTALIYGYLGLASLAGCFALGTGRPGLLPAWGLSGSLLTVVSMRFLGEWFGLIGAAWANAGFLLNLVVTVLIVRHLRFDARKIAQEYLPTFVAPFLCWLLVLNRLYIEMSLAGHVIAYLLVVPVLGYWVVGRDLSQELLEYAELAARRWTQRRRDPATGFTGVDGQQQESSAQVAEPAQAGGRSGE